MVALKGQIEMVEVATAQSDKPKVVRMWPVDAREALRVGSHVPLRPVQAEPAEPKAADKVDPASLEQVANLTKAQAPAAPTPTGAAARMAEASKQADAVGSGASKA